MDFKVKNLTDTWFSLNGEILHARTEMMITGRDIYLNGLGDELLRLTQSGAISTNPVYETEAAQPAEPVTVEESVNPNTGV